MHSYSHSHNKTLHKVVTTSLPSQTTITHTSRSSLTFHFSLFTFHYLSTSHIPTFHIPLILYPTSLPPPHHTILTPKAHQKTHKNSCMHFSSHHKNNRTMSCCPMLPHAPPRHAMPCHAMPCPKRRNQVKPKKKKAITRRLEGRKEKEKRRTPQNAGVF